MRRLTLTKRQKDIVDGCSFDNNVPRIAEKEVFAVDSICDYLIHHTKENGAYQITDPMLLEQLVALVTTEKRRSQDILCRKECPLYPG